MPTLPSLSAHFLPPRAGVLHHNHPLFPAPA
jgi:hypothetical protein